MRAGFDPSHVIQAGIQEFGSDRHIFRPYLDLNSACPNLRTGCIHCPEDYAQCSKYQGVEK